MPVRFAEDPGESTGSHGEPLLSEEGAITPTRSPFERARVKRLTKRLTTAGERVIAELKRHKKQYLAGGLGIGVVVGIIVLITAIKTSSVADVLICGARQENYLTVKHYSAQSGNLVGTNFGGWLCLEDWIFAGSVGRYVSTPDQLANGQGACLPPLVPGPRKKPWGSEGTFTAELVEERGEAGTAHAFQAHRETFIQEDDFRLLQSLGIKSVRIPLTWSVFADALKPLDPKVYGSHNPEFDSVVVPDPFYVNEAKYVTIPRAWLKAKLQLAAKYGLRAILDIHNMPGGSSQGTYSGVWPLRPSFWDKNAQIGNKSVPLMTLGLWINQALIDWVETLDDLLKHNAIWGLCMMNEPGHKSAWASKGAPPAHVGWARENEILQYLEDYSNLFRKSSLPARGLRLYLQLIETAFRDFDRRVAPWYHSFFTDQERHTWAVISRHFYTAWNPKCNGFIMPGASYQCDEPLDKIRMSLSCIREFATDFATNFNGLRAVTEFSLGTAGDTNMGCQNSEVLRTLMLENMKAFATLEDIFKVEPFFWTWHQPYGPKFEPGWSLKFFSGLSSSKNSNGACIVGDWAKENPLQSLT